MGILLVLLILVITLLSIIFVGQDSNKDKESNEELKKKVIENGWQCSEEDIFASGKLDKGVVWKVRKEEGEAIWFIDNICFAEEYLWILAKKRTVVINYSSSLAQFFLVLGHGRDEAQKLSNLQKMTIDKAEFDDLFVVLATNKSLVKNILTDNIIDLLVSWYGREKSKPLPKIMLSKNGLEIKINQSSLDFPLLNRFVELGEAILKEYSSSYTIQYKSY